MLKELAVGAGALAILAAGGTTAYVLTNDGADSDAETFCAEFRPNEEITWQAGKPLAKWATQNPGEKTAWVTFADGICSDGNPTPPVLVSAHGKAIVAAGVLALPDAEPPVTTTTPPAVDFYVATSGNDTNLCTQSAPCKSFQRAYTVAQRDSVIQVANGTYPGQALNYDPAKGTDCSQRVTFRAESAHGVYLGQPFVDSGLGGYSLLLGRYSNIAPPSCITFDGIDFYRAAIMQRAVSATPNHAVGISILNAASDCVNCSVNLNAVGVEDFELINFEGPEFACCATEGVILIGSAGPPSSWAMSRDVLFDNIHIRNVDQTCTPLGVPLAPDCAARAAPANPNVHPDCIQSGRPIINFTVQNSRFERCEENNFSATDICADNSEQWSGTVLWKDNVFTASHLFDIKMYAGDLSSNCNVPAFPDSAVVRFENNTFSKDFPEIRNAHPNADIIATGNRSPTRPPGTQGITNSNGACKTASYAGYAGFTTYQSSSNVYGNGICGPTDSVG